jgi:hypothetical protein
MFNYGNASENTYLVFLDTRSHVFKGRDSHCPLLPLPKYGENHRLYHVRIQKSGYLDKILIALDHLIELNTLKITGI